jgi:hypothetical protein
MSDWFLEQWINIKFCVILGKNASDAHEVLSKAYGGDAMRTWKMIKEVVIQDLTEFIS